MPATLASPQPHQVYLMNDFTSNMSPDMSRTPSPSAASIAPIRAPVAHRVSTLQEIEALKAEVELEGIRLTPPPSAVETGYNPHAPSPLEDYPVAPQLNYRASITNALKDRYNKLPPMKAQQLSSLSSALPSPTKTWANFVTQRSTRDDASPSASVASSRRAGSRASLFGDLLSLNGSSAPVSLGILPSNRSYNSSEADSDLAYGSEMDAASQYASSPRRRESRRVPSNGSINRLSSWFGGRGSAAPTAPNHRRKMSTMTVEEEESQRFISEDPLLTLNLNAALFPHGPADPLNPSHFHDLLSNAESLIRNMQDAYRSKLIALEDLRHELAAQNEEIDETETRARHLKVQLDDMGGKVQDQESMICDLGRQLEIERRQRMEEKDVERQRNKPLRRGAVRRSPTISIPTVPAKPAAAPQNHDSGFESGEESDATSAAPASVFSDDEVLGRGISPATSAGIGQDWAEEQKAFQRQQLYRGAPGPVTMDLSGENRMLKRRVAELEEAVDSCLLLVTGPIRR